MYSKQVSHIKVCDSPILQANNLSVSSRRDQVCFVSDNDVIISDVKGDSKKISYEKKYTLNQCLFVTIRGKEFIVVLSNIDVKIWTSNGDSLVYSFGLREIIDTPDTDDHYFKGVGYNNDLIAIG